MSLNLDRSAWKHVAFGDVVRNANVNVRDPESAGIDRVIAMEHLDGGELKVNRWGSLEDGTTFTRRVTPRQTLFGKRRAYQRKVAYAEFDAVCSGDILTFEADELQLLPEFLPFLVQSDRFFDHALGTSAGSLSPRTNWRDLSTFEFDLPPLEEQRRIADLLWAVETMARAQADQRQAIACGRQVWLDGRVSDLVEAKKVNFSDVWSESPQSGYSAAPVDEATGRYVLSLAALGPDGYRPGHLKNVPDTDKIRAATLRRGDLLVSRANTVDAVGRVGIYSEEREDVSFPDTMMRLNLKSQVLPKFAAAVISSSHGRAHMRRSAAGSATSMVKINRTSLGRLPFPVVTLEDQRALLKELSLFDSALDSTEADAGAFRVLRGILLAEIFGGK
ncbi:restriction endonuclease subunit S [Arthrobacter sunyaminii]|uniref:Restriction endonuclease subunit S n=1 Tax=Arthrobacter sunyaminii TaxID=2816859 RepID=A0A975S6R3_9MICC|nr:restriction endonuclease subunit S [Arthrobacter sunyaminii]MBO0907798.1 restriction endonuclease subunit S [Arthrobacter sunyaminii]QWQ36857.1 restriction endonuclease subunit S [Arthrobacter sunyaminii]